MDESWLMLMVAFLAGALVATLAALLVVALRESQVRAQAAHEAEVRFERLKAELNTAAARTSEAKLAEWKVAEEKRIRQSAASGSRAVIKGKVAEQLAPLLPGFEYNPSDARFIGDPVDYVIFHGYTGLKDGQADGGNAKLEIVILDVKTGESAGLTREQRAIRDAVTAQRVRFEVAHVRSDTLNVQIR
jgi:predicted Holliday junction resolvase-like endonuclease